MSLFPGVAFVFSTIRCKSGHVSKCPCIMYLIMGQIRMTANEVVCVCVCACASAREGMVKRMPETIQYFSPSLTNVERKFVAEITAKDARYARNSGKLQLLNRINSQSSRGAREQYIIINEFHAGEKFPLHSRGSLDTKKRKERERKKDSSRA